MNWLPVEPADHLWHDNSIRKARTAVRFGTGTCAVYPSVKGTNEGYRLRACAAYFR